MANDLIKKTLVFIWKNIWLKKIILENEVEQFQPNSKSITKCKMNEQCMQTYLPTKQPQTCQSLTKIKHADTIKGFNYQWCKVKFSKQLCLCGKEPCYACWQQFSQGSTYASMLHMLVVL